MSAKKYVTVVSLSLLIFMAGNVILWNTVTRKLFDGHDLGRMGGFWASESETSIMTPSGHHTEFADYIGRGIKESFDVITIGDSFLNGDERYYFEDYLADEYGLKVINFRLEWNCIEDLYILIGSGIIDELSPRYVILESVEREAPKRFASRIITPGVMDKDKLFRSVLSIQEKKPKAAFLAPIMTEVNKNYLMNKLSNIFAPEQLGPEVYITELDREMFTNKGQENLLLYYHHDMDFTSSTLNTETLSRNLSNAAAMLKEKGIKMIFFVAPDKYDLYYPYIRNKTDKPANTFFDSLRTIKPEGYVMIDTLSVLRSALERGEKDVYIIDDTHWSHKGIKIVCDEIAKYLLTPKLN